MKRETYMKVRWRVRGRRGIEEKKKEKSTKRKRVVKRIGVGRKSY